jgi:Ca-activated chloride channel family protein
LLLVGVQAGGLAHRPQAATHLVIALDLSYSMSRGGRLEIVQRGISRLLDQLGARDRLSLVVFGEEVTHVVEAATRDDAASIRILLDDLTPRGGTNLAAGLQRAASLAMTDVAGSAAARRLVLVTDSEATMPGDVRRGIDQMLGDARELGVRLDVLDVSQRSLVDPTLQSWAFDLQGDVRPIADARQMQRSLLEALSGGEPTIAREARLKLHFNPQTVAAYRLVGHESNSLADLTPATLEAELTAGESAAALVEVWFQPGDGDDLGYAELTWNDPAGGPTQRVRQRFSRLQFAPSLTEAPVPLVQAALAAEVGEVLRGSEGVMRQAGIRPAAQRGLAAVLEVADSANPQLRQRPDMQRLLRIVRQLKAQGLK